eukprot:m.143799 g.143799  ORF g.143799 m.143799 type:complete len:471 (+) comp17702_c0_seq20:161-1573(+)
MNRDAQIPTREQLDALAALAMDSSDTDEDISPPHDSNEPSKETILRRTVSNRLAHAIPTHLSPLPPPQRTTIAEDKDGSDLFIDDDEDDFDSDSDDAFLFDTEKIFPYGFRLLSYNISCKANLDAEAKGFPKSIARAIYATGVDVAILTGIGSGTHKRDVVGEIMGLLGWGKDDPDHSVHYTTKGHRTKRVMECGAGVAVLSRFPIIEEIRWAFKTQSALPASARAVRLSINVDKSDGRAKRAIGKLARSQLMWIVGLNIESDTDQVHELQMRELTGHLDMLRGGIPIFVGGTLKMGKNASKSVLYRGMTSRLKCDLIDAAKESHKRKAMVEAFAGGDTPGPFRSPPKHTAPTTQRKQPAPTTPRKQAVPTTPQRFTSPTSTQSPAPGIAEHGLLHSAGLCTTPTRTSNGDESVTAGRPDKRQDFVFYKAHKLLRDMDLSCAVLDYQTLRKLRVKSTASDHLPVLLTWMI